MGTGSRAGQPAGGGEPPPGPGTGLPEPEGRNRGRKYTAERALLEETPMTDTPSRGLADIIAASTAPGDADGRAALLFYRGYGIHRPAGNRLVRPDSEYVGERGLARAPLDRR